jgi:hypothetical protein
LVLFLHSGRNDAKTELEAVTGGVEQPDAPTRRASSAMQAYIAMADREPRAVGSWQHQQWRGVASDLLRRALYFLRKSNGRTIWN